MLMSSVFEWMDGTPFDQQGWERGQPDHHLGREWCGAAGLPGFALQDAVCLTLMPFVCEADSGEVLKEHVIFYESIFSINIYFIFDYLLLSCSCSLALSLFRSLALSLSRSLSLFFFLSLSLSLSLTIGNHFLSRYVWKHTTTLCLLCLH